MSRRGSRSDYSAEWTDVAQSIVEWEEATHTQILVVIWPEPALPTHGAVVIEMYERGCKGAGPPLSSFRAEFNLKKNAGQAAQILYALNRACIEYEEYPWNWSRSYRAKRLKGA